MSALGLRPPPLPALGAPGVYLLPEVAPPVLGAEPMDVAAFVGVAPRGAAWEPVGDPTLHDAGIFLARSVAVPVDSWDDYVQEFGAFEGPGLLPHAVAAFFAQGGRRAHVVRIVHDEHAWVDGRPAPLGCALHELDLAGGTTLAFRARNEGAWGDRLAITLRFTTRPVALTGTEPSALLVPPGAHLPVGALVRLHGAAGDVALRWVTAVSRRGRAHATDVDHVVTLDAPSGFVPLRAEEVTADLVVVDRDPLRTRVEHHSHLGLDAAHPLWLGTAIERESRLVLLDGSPTRIDVQDASLPDALSHLAEGGSGTDRWELVTPADVFGRVLLGDTSGVEGLDALLGAPEVATVVVPDLYSPAPVRTAAPVTVPGVFAGSSFAPCLDGEDEEHPAPPATGLTGLRLDPTIALELETIVGLQQELVRTAERLQLVALLDVPPRIRRNTVLRWRARFDSSFAAAYYPWVRVPMVDAGEALGTPGPLVELPPSAVAAGIIARCERRNGISHGPANEIAALAVDVLDEVTDREHDELHPQGVNVLRRTPDGIRVGGARTLSTERELRQLTVRRLLLLIERAVARQLLWTVFEPNDDHLRIGLKRMVERLLGELFDRGSFAGATRELSWFVRVATGAEAWREADRGELVVEIGVAPSEPTEFILLRVVLDDDGAVRTATQLGVEEPVVVRA